MIYSSSQYGLVIILWQKKTLLISLQNIIW